MNFSRRLRATLVMMVCWALGALVFGIIVIAGMSAFAASQFGGDFFRLFSVNASRSLGMFATIGAIGGLGFSFTLARLARRGEANPLEGSTWCWFTIGALVAMVIYVARFSVDSFSLVKWLPIMVAGVVFGTLSAAIGRGLIAISHRGKALPLAHDEVPLPLPSDQR